jgi:proteasome lid subunit RPN8/RPN11
VQLTDHMPLLIAPDQLEAIRQHAAREYPSECCGVLLGLADGSAKRVREVVALRNLRHDAARAQEFLPLADPWRESERNRYLIDPGDLLKVEKDARQRGLEVLGYYHSHPDHPARPSEYDREYAWPWCSYVIINVAAGRPGDYASWVLASDRSRFEPEPIELTENHRPEKG